MKMKCRVVGASTVLLALTIVFLWSLVPTGNQPFISQAAGASGVSDRPLAQATMLGNTIYVDITNNTGIEDGTPAHPFNTIQEGINIAVSEETILVSPGIYLEKINLMNGIRLVGSGSDVTIIDGTDQDDSVVSANNLDHETIVQGFTITHGTGKHIGGYTYGGGVFATNSWLVFRDNLFIDNFANDGTGGLQTEFSTTLIDHCVFQDNQGWWGGSISIHGGSATVQNSLLNGSVSYYGGAFFITTAAQVSSLNNIIMHTSQPPAIGIGDEAVVTITNNTIVENNGNGIATGVYLVGGGIGTATITNTILWDNEDDLVNLEATYSVIEDGDPGIGNISANPMFVDLDYHDYHLLKASPAVDSGTNVLAPGLDYEDDPRPVDGNGDGNFVTDIGADEYYPLEVVKETTDAAISGGRLDYYITLDNTLPMTITNVQLTDHLPLLVSYIDGSLESSSGDFGYSTDIITWTGSITPGDLITIQYATEVDASVPIGAELVNVLVIQETGRVITRTKSVEVGYHHTFMPTIHRPLPGIHGFVTDKGNPVSGIWVELWFFDGFSWYSRGSTMVVDGNYAFVSAPSLLPEQRYSVLFMNDTNPDQLWVWSTRDLDTYTAGTSINIGNFDIGNVTLVYPLMGAWVNLPVTFQWTARPYAPTDSYELDLYDPYDLDPYFYPIVGYTGSYTLNSLSPGFNVGELYTWEIWIISPDGGYGISYEYRDVYFANQGLSGIPLNAVMREKALTVLELQRQR